MAKFERKIFDLPMQIEPPTKQTTAQIIKTICHSLLVCLKKNYELCQNLIILNNFMIFFN